VAVQKRLQTSGGSQPTQPYPVTLIRQPTANEPTETDPTPIPANGPGNLSSAGSAALHAIKRHSIEFANAKDLQVENLVNISFNSHGNVCF
jgi:AT-rich interactive domain-containing protein 2